MSRSSPTPRIARREDAPVLAELWGDALRRVDRPEQLADLELVIKAAAASPEQRFVVAEYDGQLAGARLPAADDGDAAQPRSVRAVRSTARFRPVPPSRHRPRADGGCGGVRRGERRPARDDRVPAASRDANRFMARLALAPFATVRVAPTYGRPQPTDAAGARARRSTPRVLVARRNQRRVAGSRTGRGAAPRLISAGDQRAGDPRRADPLAALVGDDHVVGRAGPAEVDRGRHAGDDAGGRGAVVGGVDVHADRELPYWVGVDGRSRRSRASRPGRSMRRRAAGRRAGCCPRPASSPTTRSAEISLSSMPSLSLSPPMPCGIWARKSSMERELGRLLGSWGHSAVGGGG